jgi:hypothetical protein
MSSLQKFHRRTNGGTSGPFIFTGNGTGNATVGYQCGTYSGYKIICAPSSTETALAWGSYGIARGTTSKTAGNANTTTLSNLGTAAHPAAAYVRALTTGGYTWDLLAENEMPNTLVGQIQGVTANSGYWTSTEEYTNATYQNKFAHVANTGGTGFDPKSAVRRVRGFRRV